MENCRNDTPVSLSNISWIFLSKPVLMIIIQSFPKLCNKNYKQNCIMDDRERDLVQINEDYQDYEKRAKELSQKANAKRLKEQQKEKYRKAMNAHMIKIMKGISLIKEKGEGIKSTFFIHHFLTSIGQKSADLSGPVYDALKKEVSLSIKVLDALAEKQKIGPFCRQSKNRSLLDKNRKIFYCSFTHVGLKEDYQKYMSQISKQQYFWKKKKTEDKIDGLQEKLQQKDEQINSLREEIKRLKEENRRLKDSQNRQEDLRMEIVWESSQKSEARNQSKQSNLWTGNDWHPQVEEKRVHKADVGIPKLQECNTELVQDTYQKERSENQFSPSSRKSLFRKTEIQLLYQKKITRRQQQKFQEKDLQTYMSLAVDVLSTIKYPKYLEPQSRLKKPKQRKQKEKWLSSISPDLQKLTGRPATREMTSTSPRLPWSSPSRPIEAEARPIVLSQHSSTSSYETPTFMVPSQRTSTHHDG